MKHTLSLTLALMMAISGAFAKDNATVKQTTIKNGNIAVTYGQPARNGKTVFATNANDKTALLPFAKVFRPGGEEGTQITFTKDCFFNTFPLKAGTYTLLIQPLNLEWVLTLNSELNQKGAFNYDKVKSNNVLTVATGAKKLDKPVEKFTITLNDDGMLIEWDSRSCFVPIKYSAQ